MTTDNFVADDHSPENVDHSNEVAHDDHPPAEHKANNDQHT